MPSGIFLLVGTPRCGVLEGWIGFSEDDVIKAPSAPHLATRSESAFHLFLHAHHDGRDIVDCHCCIVKLGTGKLR